MARQWWEEGEAQLKQGDGEERRLATKRIGMRARELTAAQREHLSRVLTRLLARDPWEPVQMWAAWALGLLRRKYSFNALVRALSDDNGDVRCHAALALGRIGDPRAIGKLKALFRDDSDELIRAYAVRGLGYFVTSPHNEAGRHALRRIASDDTTPPLLREAAKEQLAQGTSWRGGGRSVVQMQLLTPPEGSFSPPPPCDDALGRPVDRKRVWTTVPRRDSRLKERQKRLYGHVCQVCGKEGFEVKGGGKYSEVHHMWPIEQHGFDSASNMLVVCAECHRKLHYASQVKYEPHPRVGRPERVTINGQTFDIHWKDSRDKT